MKPVDQTFVLSYFSEINKWILLQFWREALLPNKHHYVMYVLNTLNAWFHSVLEVCDDKQ